MAPQKRNFVLSTGPHVTATPEERAATALEFIAHYLDRIDEHLERLAGTVHADTANTTKIALELTTIAQILNNRNP